MLENDVRALIDYFVPVTATVIRDRATFLLHVRYRYPIACLPLLPEWGLRTPHHHHQGGVAPMQLRANRLEYAGAAARKSALFAPPLQCVAPPLPCELSFSFGVPPLLSALLSLHLPFVAEFLRVRPHQLDTTRRTEASAAVRSFTVTFFPA